MNQTKQFYNVADIARECNKSITFVRNKIDDGKLKAVKIKKKQKTNFFGKSKTFTRIVLVVPKVQAARFIAENYKSL